MTLNTITKHADDVLVWVKRQFGDESGVQITDSDILRWLNQAQLEIATQAKAIQAIDTGALVAGQFAYDVPLSNAIEIIAITVNDIPVEGLEFQVANEYLLSADPTRTMTQTTPSYFWRFANRLYFWPTPDTSAAAGIDIYYVKSPDTIGSASDLLGLPDKYFEAILQFVMSKAYELDEDYSASQQARQAFTERLGLNFEEDKSETLYYPTLSFVED